MKTWKVYYTINDEEYTDYVSADLEISDELYDKIQEKIKNYIPVDSGEVGTELEKLAQKHYERYITDMVYDEYDYPKPWEYNNEEDYEKEVEKYHKYFLEDGGDEECYKEFLEELNDWKKCRIEGYTVDYFTFEDPNDLNRLADRLKDVCSKKYSGENSRYVSFEFQYFDEMIINYDVCVEFDKKGHIVDVIRVRANGLESEDCRRSNFDECYPDFGFVEDEIRAELAEK